MSINITVPPGEKDSPFQELSDFERCRLGRLREASLCYRHSVEQIGGEISVLL